MNILSLFDGMSCARVALDRAGITVDNYYASEIDKYAISVAQKNYPSTIQLGDVTKVNCDYADIDLLVGGSPCQGFSFAGKGLAFDDPRSKLFFEFVRIFKQTQPKYFLLENVRMKKEYQDVISNLLGVEPICINSALVSAQNRVRYYWTNIPGVVQPDDKGTLLKHVLEGGENTLNQYPRGKNNGGFVVGKSPTLTNNSFEQNVKVFTDRDKSYCIDANYFKGGSLKNYLYKKRRQLVMCQSEKRLCVQTGAEHWRKLTVIECERLQTLPDNYTQGVSNTQRYKMLGNGMTVDVIAHILRCLREDVIIRGSSIFRMETINKE